MVTLLASSLMPMCLTLAAASAKAPSRVYGYVVAAVAILFAGMVVGLSLMSSKRDHRD